MKIRVPDEFFICTFFSGILKIVSFCEDSKRPVIKIIYVHVPSQKKFF